MAVVARHLEAELGDGGLAVGEQARAERRIGPRPGDDAGAVLRHPLLLDEMVGLDDELARRHAAVVEAPTRSRRRAARRRDGAG